VNEGTHFPFHPWSKAGHSSSGAGQLPVAVKGEGLHGNGKASLTDLQLLLAAGACIGHYLGHG